MQCSSTSIDEPRQPFVSIIVTTYNSAKYVIKTLQSAMKQTYQNIELVVSDDCSKDDTVELCARWIEDNNHRFVRTALVTSSQHSGIAPNFNQGLKVAKGLWVKFIAGDDILKDNCIADCIDYINNSPEKVEILSGAMKQFTGNIESLDLAAEYSNELDTFFTKSAKEQHLLLLKANRIMAPAVLIRRSLLASMHGFDERYPMLEDYPFWLKATEKGIRIHGFSKIICFYRIHAESVYSSALVRPYVINPFYEHVERFEKDYVYERLNHVQKLERKCRYARYRLVSYLGNNCNNLFVRHLNKLLDPVYLHLKLKSWSDIAKKPMDDSI